MIVLVKNGRVSCIDDRLYKVSRVINLDQRTISFANDTLFNLFLCLHLEHFSSLTDQIEPSAHLISQLLLELLKALQLDESDRIDRAFGRNVELIGRFRQQGKRFGQIYIDFLFV